MSDSLELPPAALPDVYRLLSWGLRAGVTFAPDPDGTLRPLAPPPLPDAAGAALVRMGAVTAAALDTLQVPAPGLAQAVLWWEVASRQLHLSGREQLPAATTARRERLVALRAVHLLALADVALAGAPISLPLPIR
ncbi:MAG: hypothetical protein IPF47_14530 [Gemmatimonadetes bacterium]|nr:hypothetical protein [Gemmatimonadota bacterium]